MMGKHEATKGASVTIVPQWKPNKIHILLKHPSRNNFLNEQIWQNGKKKISEKYIVSIAIQTTTAYNLLNIFDSSKIIS